MRISKVCIMLLAAMSFFSACEDYGYDEYKCTCVHGSPIDGWEEPDTTNVNSTDTLGRFDISLEIWGDTETHDVEL